MPGNRNIYIFVKLKNVKVIWMNHKYKVITIILLATISVLSLAALLMLPNKVFFSVLFAISTIGLIVNYIFSNNKELSHDAGHKKYSDFIIIDELDCFFSRKRPYLNADYKISDLEKQLKISRGAISSFTKERFGINFNQFLNLWRIAELQRLQSLMENEDESLSALCVKAGFKNVTQYYQAEKERKAKKMRKSKNKPIVKKIETDIVDELDFKKKPEIKRRI